MIVNRSLFLSLCFLICYVIWAFIDIIVTDPLSVTITKINVINIEEPFQKQTIFHTSSKEPIYITRKQSLSIEYVGTKNRTTQYISERRFIDSMNNLYILNQNTTYFGMSGSFHNNVSFRIPEESYLGCGLIQGYSYHRYSYNILTMMNPIVRNIYEVKVCLQ